jgi:hypothetical protein
MHPIDYGLRLPHLLPLIDSLTRHLIKKFILLLYYLLVSYHLLSIFESILMIIATNIFSSNYTCYPLFS